MWKYFGCGSALLVVALCAVGSKPVLGQQLLSGFENTLASTAGGTPWQGLWTVPPEYTTVGATEGSSALVLHHSPTWVTEGTMLKAGLPLAQQVAQHDFMQIDLTTADSGIAGDGWAPAWRQVFVVFNSNQGGWQQNQLDFPVASDDGGSLTYTILLDLAATGIKANAQNFVNAGPGDGTYWELFLIFQGGDQGTPIKAGDYAADDKVTAADYVNWRNSVGGTSLTNETVSLGSVDAEDYTEWKAHFGKDYTLITTIIDNVRFANAGAGTGSLST
jgi:hypothetical protein